MKKKNETCCRANIGDRDSSARNRVLLPGLPAIHGDHEPAVTASRPAEKINAKTDGCLLASLFILISLAFTAPFQNAQAAEPFADASPCSCHQDLIAAELNKGYVHLPFLQRQCEACHVVPNNDVGIKEDNPFPQDTDQTGKRIRWFDYTATPAPENWFFLPAPRTGLENLVVSASDGVGKSFQEMLELPAIETLPIKVTETRGPAIRSVEVRGVYRKGFIFAEIGWSTDKMADSEVRYGIDALQYAVKQDALAIDHEVVLQNLKADETYHYNIISRDIFGNSVVSETGAFSTADPSSLPPVKYVPPLEADILLRAQFFRNEDSRLVKITANQPVILKVGWATVAGGRKPVPEAAVMPVPDPVIVNDPGHLPLRSIDEISSEACRQCHAKMFNSGNHAIDVGPSYGMIIPAEYSTDSAGHITCTTCHNPHASDFAYLTVRKHSLELCIGCHKDYDLPPWKRTFPLLMAKQ